jgi:transcriptional regulator with XRE-family HTH domain
MRKKSKFDMSVINTVREMRLRRKLTQDDIAEFINSSRGFVGQVESSNSRSRYSVDQLNRIALGMNCSPRDFLPEKAVKG